MTGVQTCALPIWCCGTFSNNVLASFAEEINVGEIFFFIWNWIFWVLSNIRQKIFISKWDILTSRRLIAEIDGQLIIKYVNRLGNK